MKKTNLILVMMMLVLTFSGTAYAAVLYTAPLNATYVECSVVNVDSKAREVTIRLFESVGGAISMNRESDVNLQPGEVAALHNMSGDPGSTDGVLRYCTFDVKGGKKSLRAGARSLDGDNIHVSAE